GESPPDLFVAVSNQVVHDAFRFPADNRLETGQRVIAVANRFPGLERGYLQQPLSLSGFLPIQLRKMLKLRLRGLKLKVGHGVDSSIHKTKHTIGPAKRLCQ